MKVDSDPRVVTLDVVSPSSTLYSRCLKMYPAPLGPCERGCGREAKHRHHISGDISNNARENVEFLCAPCHVAHHKTKPKPCSNCGRECRPRRYNGRCARCRAYFRYHGVERP